LKKYFITIITVVLSVTIGRYKHKHNSQLKKFKSHNQICE